MTPSSHPSTQPDSTHADSGMASSYDYVSDQSMMTGAHVGRHAREAAKVHRFGVNFSGSGSEYFRIWIVNLLLLIVTFGLYYPWAKVRKLRYFYNHTEVAGHPFDFHGNPRQMLRGFLLMAALLLAYGLAGNVSETAGAIAGLILALVWPALLRASLQFRLAQTSWRGLRFSFRGSMKDAYMVFLVPGLMMVGALVVFGILMVVLLPGRAAQGPMAPHQLGMAGLLSLLLLAAFMSLMPYLLWRLKAYQHRHYALGPWQTTFTATFGEMWRVFLRSSMVLLAGGVLVVALAGVWSWLAGSMDTDTSAGTKGALIRMLPVMLVGFFLVQLLYSAHLTASLQNLVWTRTGNRQIRFKSELSHWRLMTLMLKNMVLTGLTLGLYWPFAAVAMAKLKLEAIQVHTRQHPDELVVHAQHTYKDAAGDMAGDLMGLDVGL